MKPEYGETGIWAAIGKYRTGYHPDGQQFIPSAAIGQSTLASRATVLRRGIWGEFPLQPGGPLSPIHDRKDEHVH
jgi:hypothetical protein